MARAIEVFAGLRQFEICSPFTAGLRLLLGQLLCARWPAASVPIPRAVLESIGGNGPQKLVTEFAGSTPPAISRWR